MKILVVSHGHPAFSIGGAEIASHNLFTALDQLPGVEAYYLARAAHPIARHRQTPLMSLRQGARETFLWADDYDHALLSNQATDDLSGAFRRYLLDVRPDVVHFHHFIGLGIESMWEVRRTLPNAAIVVTFHEYLPICLHHGQMIKTSKQRLCNRASPADCHACFPELSPARIFERELFLKTHLGVADAFVGPSRFLIERYVAWGIPEDRFTMLENGIDTARPAAPRALPPGGRRARCGFFGQITEFKGIAVLLDAITRVPDEVWGNDAALCIFGGNLENQPEAFRQSFDELIARAGRRAKFYGSYSAEELPDLMRQVDWVVVPSIWWENSPLVIQEAYLHGRPLIVSDIGGMKEKVADGVAGMHFRVGSAEDLADKMTQALADPQSWERLLAGAAKPLSREDAARQHLALYKTLIEDTSRAQPARSAPSAQQEERGVA
jgi:glycosyltransferase involved in cell wall biosynthesis